MRRCFQSRTVRCGVWINEQNSSNSKIPLPFQSSGTWIGPTLRSDMSGTSSCLTRPHRLRTADVGIGNSRPCGSDIDRGLFEAATSGRELLGMAFGPALPAKSWITYCTSDPDGGSWKRRPPSVGTTSQHRCCAHTAHITVIKRRQCSAPTGTFPQTHVGVNR